MTRAAFIQSRCQVWLRAISSSHDCRKDCSCSLRNQRLVYRLTSKPRTDSRIDDVEISQPACTAVPLALVDLLREWGVTAPMSLAIQVERSQLRTRLVSCHSKPRWRLRTSAAWLRQKCSATKVFKVRCWLLVQVLKKLKGYDWQWPLCCYCCNQQPLRCDRLERPNNDR